MSQATKAVEAITTLREHAENIAQGLDKRVRPGERSEFTAACGVNDCYPQGDLYITIIAETPFSELGDSVMVPQYDRDGNPTGESVEYKLRVLEPNASAADRELAKQLVPGNTQGAKHCLPTLEGVKVYMPPVWNDEVLTGPVIAVEKALDITHPKHGHIGLVPGHVYECTYPREADKERRLEERRNRD